MRRVDALLLKVQQAERLDDMQVSVCIVRHPGEKWEAIVDLWNGVDYPRGRSQRLILETDTEEEALAAIEEVKAAHAPTGHRASAIADPSIIIIDVPKDTEAGKAEAEAES